MVKQGCGEIRVNKSPNGQEALLECFLHRCGPGVQQQTNCVKRGQYAKHPTNGFTISNQEKSDLIAFLHALTDTEFLTNPEFTR